jgi:hypothetical protein
MNDDFQMFPVLGVILCDLWSARKHGGEVTKMPTPVLVDGTIPVMVIAKRTGSTIGGTNSVEAGEAMIALNSVRYRASWWRPYCDGADAGEIFIGRREIVIRSGGVDDILEYLLTMGPLVVSAVPR